MSSKYAHMSDVDLEKTLEAALEVLRKNKEQPAKPAPASNPGKITTKQVVPSIFIATPSLNGPRANYHSFALQLQRDLHDKKLDYRFHMMDGCSLIPVARNALVREFMSSGMTHMLMMDDDIWFDTKDFFRMLELGRPFVSGAVPMRKFNVEFLESAVAAGAKTDLQKYTTQFNIGMHDYNKDIVPDEKGAVEIKFSGTACLLVMREAVQKIIDQTAPKMYHDEGRETYDLFDCRVDVENKQFIGEDARFCERYRMTGGKIWCLPDIEFVHHGPIPVKGKLTDSFQWND